MPVVIHEFEVEPSGAESEPAATKSAPAEKKEGPPPSLLESMLRRQRERAARLRAH